MCFATLLCAHSSTVGLLIAFLLVLRSFAPAAFTAFFATTTSADFLRTLARKTSPGKVHELSARAVWLYPMRLSVTVGFRVCSHAHRPHRGLTASSCSYGRAFATDFFRADCLTAPALSFASVVVTVSDQYVSIDEFIPTQFPHSSFIANPINPVQISAAALTARLPPT